ncbi:aminopeptidase P family protein [Rubellimicrobium sp. CFH 75288]|uniref:aminopeptidase P family protein n=1 Tax=Rubellimicrobium sp. CFH 75288 TaxID=2697034 RepID=UPI001411D9DC|nr:aminopeptidase P family protein [Rubellimicrobium sp. CFH 75288]NAZ35386.1 M24 family metallopeptidase [Rubellimicrobium sp. CFH 75288]
MSLQSFAETADPSRGPARLAALRERMASDGLDAVLIPRADRFGGEYVAPCDERLAWLTGFTGSAGSCAVTAAEAALFVDGRYRLQARAQVAPDFAPVDWPATRPADWLLARLPEGGVVGFDPWLHPVEEVEGLRTRLAARSIRLLAVPNPVDALWQDRPAPPSAPFFPFPEAIAGEASGSKRDRLAAALREAGEKAAILTQPDSVAWLLNIRGGDVPRNPVPHAFAILHDDGTCDLFAAPPKADPVREALGPAVRHHPEDAFTPALGALAGPVRLDPRATPFAVLSALEGAGVAVARGTDPCLLPKARKNPAEIAATAEAHHRDGAAMARFLHWLDREAPGGGLTEIAVVRALEGFRRDTGALRDISFETIAGAGAHGAIVHYRVTEATDAPVRPGELLLVDSGGQYLDGTTDITRTVAVGEPPAGAPEAFTRVLQGLVAISRARFPRGVAGQHLDALARYPLWLAGQDYDHGTGHGVGLYLSVHEGPQRLSRLSDVPLEPGMILSNEPGHYREGAWGIRLENLVVVEEASPLPGGDEGRDWLGFRTLTWAPFDRRLIRPALLSGPERDWVDAYHRAVLERIAPLVPEEVRAWLGAACAPL